jgi:transposase
MSRRGFWNETRQAEVRASLAAGETLREMAKRYGVSRQAVSGIIFRMGLTKKRWKRPESDDTPPQKLPTWRKLNADIKPSLTPFAPDDTCPDFAWDDDHCAAVNALGGYVALNFRRVA